MNNTPKESDECIAFANWCRFNNLLFCHISSETSIKNWAFLRKRKAMGVNSGAPDYLVVTPKGLVFVEMKRIKGSVTSPEQTAWIEALNGCEGVEAKICKGAQDAIDFVEQFL